MKNRILALAALMSVGSSSLLLATTELRTPLTLVKDFGPFHYRLEPVSDDCWTGDIFAALYARRADDGLANRGGGNRETVSLGQLYFGTSCVPAGCGNFSFTLDQTFAGGIGVVPNNPFVSISLIRPVFTYTEKGLIAGGHIQRRFDCSNWRVGARAVLPFKLIRTDRDINCYDLETGSLDELGVNVQQVIDPTIPVPNGTLLINGRTINGPLTPATATNAAVNASTIATGVTNPNSNTRNVFAYRLDFLTTLRFPGSTQDSIVNYANPSQSNHITLVSRDITNTPPVTPFTVTGASFNANQLVVTPPVDLGTGNPVPSALFDFTLLFPQNATRNVYAIRSTDGTIDNILPYITNSLDNSVDIAQDVAPAAGLAADGSGGANGARLSFDPGTNYTPLSTNRAAQRQLFVIPNSTGYGELLPDAAALKQTIDFIINSSIAALGPNPVTDFLLSKCINICAPTCQRSTGIADLDVDIFAGYDWCDNGYAELYLGVRFPTGKRNKNAGNVYYQPTGNNGHYEFKVELDLAWHPCRWFGIHTDIAYSQVFRRTEKRAASFVGATIRNIGPSIDADVSYGYGVFDLDATFFHPENCNLGMALSYQLYAKRKDKVRFCAPMALDLNGTAQLLDPTILENGTNALTNKLRGEVFHRWDYCDLFIGASRVFAGRNAFKETEAYIGIEISF